MDNNLSTIIKVLSVLAIILCLIAKQLEIHYPILQLFQIGYYTLYSKTKLISQYLSLC